MGIFSSKKVITADVQVSAIFDEKPDVMRDAVLTMVITGRPIGDVILSNGVRGFSSKVQQYYQYGKANYVLGLPQGSSISGSLNEAALTSILTGIAGEPITIASGSLSTPNTEYLAWEYLNDTYGFIHDEKKLINPPIPGSLKEFFYVNAVIDTAGTMIIEYYATEGNVPNVTGYITYVVPNYEPEDLYYNVGYYLTSDFGKDLIFWTYKMKLGTYPDLNVEKIVDNESEYLPTVPVRVDKQNLIKDPYSSLYLTASKMCQAIGIDLEDLTKNLLSRENGNDPEVIDSAFLAFAANIQSESTSTIKYLFQYFFDMAPKATTSPEAWKQWVDAGKNGEAPVNMIDISDGRMRTTIFYNYIEINYITGVIPDGKKITRETTIKPAEGEVEYSTLTFKKQLTETGYVEMVIHGLKHVSHPYQDKIVIRTLEDSKKLNNDLKPEGGFFIPVSRTVAMKISAIDRTTMYMDTFSVIVYTVQITRVKWYQRKWFKVVLTIAAIVYAVYTTDWSKVASVSAALKVAGTIVATLIINMGIIKVFTLAANLLGADIAAILTTIAAIYAVSQGALSPDNAMPWAKDLLGMTLLSYQAIQVSMQEDLLDIQKDFQDFLKNEQEKLEELKEKSELLSKNLDWFAILSPQYYFNPYESPDQFYQRSVEIKNPGILSFDSLSSYYDSKLALPKLSASDIIKEYSEQNI